MDERWWGIDPVLSGTLERRGWTPDDRMVRQVVPALARHGNAVVALPPAPAAAAPALAAIVAAVATARGRALVLTAPAMVAPMGRLLEELASDLDLDILTALGPHRAERRRQQSGPGVLVTSPSTALVLHAKSALAVDRFTSLTLAWPEGWDAEEEITLLLGDFPEATQRVVLSADPDRVAKLVERHARRALVVAAEESGEPGLGGDSIRTATTSWHDRAGSVLTIIDMLDPESAAIWTADSGDHASLAPLLSESGTLELIAGAAATTEAALVICHDPPPAATLARLGSGREVVLLSPPGCGDYLRRIAPRARPLRLEGFSDLLRNRDAGLRKEVTAMLNDPATERAGYTLGPLFENHDPQAIAAAALALWLRDRKPAGTPTAEPEQATGRSTPVGGIASTKLWVGVGRRDEATVGDLVAVLIKEAGVEREAIGRVELRETYSLVDVPTEAAEAIARRLGGKTVRRRKLVARVDRGAPQRGGSGPRGDRDRHRRG